MKLTNVHNLPSALMRFEAKNSYTKGDAEFSATQLIDAPQISRLKEIHDDEIVEDISSRALSILGTATHMILHHGSDPDDITEERFYAEVSGHRVSGQCDRLELLETVSENGEPEYCLQDYKTISGVSMIMNPDGKSEWIKQLNIYSYLASENGYRIVRLEVIAIVRDWKISQVRRNQLFPKDPIIKVEIPQWTYAEQKAYIETCVAEHTAENVRECTREERWKGNDVYAVMEYAKNGGFKARATKLFDNETDAYGMIMDNNLNAEVVLRESQPTRCVDNYCQVAPFCEQFKKEHYL